MVPRSLGPADRYGSGHVLTGLGERLRDFQRSPGPLGHPSSDKRSERHREVFCSMARTKWEILAARLEAARAESCTCTVTQRFMESVQRVDAASIASWAGFAGEGSNNALRLYL